TKPAPGGVGACRAMQMALRAAKLNPEQVDYVNAHATSTPAGDIEEARAISKVFGDHAASHKLWVSSTKGAMGHLLGAAGAVETAICALAIHHGAVPPTLNLDDPDPGCTLDFVPHESRQGDIQHAMSNSFGFGGTNAAVVVSRVEN
ncbi:MAG: beta-ketoacyl-[acyl-carrier-protein] synthase II, partial [Polyangiaceae bacterium]